MVTGTESGRVASPNRPSSTTGPASGSGPAGFDPARELARLTPYMREAILAKDPEQISTGNGGVSFYLTRRGLAEYLPVSRFKNRLALTAAGHVLRKALLRDSDGSGRQAGETREAGLDAQHDSAGRQASPETSPPTQA